MSFCPPGPLGKALTTATDLPINQRFRKITIGPDLPELTDEARNNLSTDQRYGYDIVMAVRSGVLPDRLVNLVIGPVNHSRWLTTANRFLRLWVSQHGFKGKELTNLKLICEFIVGVYYPTWFSFKINNHWLQGARTCLTQLQLTLLQNKKVLSLVYPHLESSAWWAHPEMLLQTLLCSEDQDDRKFAVEKILEVREAETAESGDNVRTRRKAKLNKDATSLKDLILWDRSEISEPVLTLGLPVEDIKKFQTAPMEVPDLPVHGQGVERCVKEVTAASEAVFGSHRRDGFIRARLAHRQMTGKLRSKKDHAMICL